MPKRTNDFQELVALVQKALAPKGATVIESAMEPVPGLTEPREIDILIESDFGPYRVKVAVEATGRSRKLDNETFGKILSKYAIQGGVKVDKVVIVTSAGFTKDVIERAKMLRVDLMTLSEAKEADWSKISPQLDFNFQPHICTVRLSPKRSVESKSGFIKEARLMCNHGKDFGTLRDFAARVFWRELWPQRPTIIQEMYEYAINSPHQEAYAKFHRPLDHHFVRFDSQDYKVKSLEITVHAVHASGKLECKEFKMISPSGEVTTIQHAEGVVGPKRFTLIFPNQPHSDRIILKVDSATPGRKPQQSTKKKAQSKTSSNKRSAAKKRTSKKPRKAKKKKP